MTDPWLEQFEARHQERQQANATLTVLGVTLTLKSSIAPQTAVRFYDTRRRLIVHNAAVGEAAKANRDPEPIPDDLVDTALLDLLDETAYACLTPESRAGWNELRSSDRPDPLGWSALFDLCDQLIARASGVPTERPAASSNGSAAATASSTAASRSKARTRKA